METYERRGGPCNHRRCQGDERGCRMYVDTVTLVTPEIEAAAAQLLRDGWISVSTKYRTLLRWRVPPPSATDVLTQEAIDGPFGAMLLDALRSFGGEMSLRMAPKELVEECIVGPATHRAFRRLRDADFRLRLGIAPRKPG